MSAGGSKNDGESTPSLFCAVGSETTSLSDEDLAHWIHKFLDSVGYREDVLLIPPDFTRYHSQSGKITQIICKHLNFIKDVGNEPAAKKSKITTTSENLLPTKIEILPALGTHAEMTADEIRKMFGSELADMNPSPFHLHDWRNDVVTIGEVPASTVEKATNGMLKRPWPAQLNKLVWEKRLHDTTKQQRKSLVLSIGQVVPHEVMGMANFNKNLFIGTGGTDAINLSHFIGAVIGMERVMGRKTNPLREILNEASEKYLQHELDLWYILTVVASHPETGELAIRGLYIGRDIECYLQACDLSLIVNFNLLDKPVKRMIAYLDPEEFHSTWLGNKAIYRTRMAMADDGELIILAPGIKRFGEDNKIDELIRRYGYKGTPQIMKMMEENDELKDNLSAVAHLIHGSSEGRFKVTYCPGYLSQQEIEQVGFHYADLNQQFEKFNIQTLTDGWNNDDEGEFYFVRNPGLGLWAYKSRFEDSD